MTPEEYIAQVKITESTDWDVISGRLNNIETLRLLHSAVGSSTEAGEVLDIIKKHVFYGKPLDREHLKEEFGDLLWYAAIGMDILDFSFEEVMKSNIDKLRVRYGKKFSEHAALNRIEHKDESLE